MFPNGPGKDVVELDMVNYPVVHVSHNDAREYCKWRGARLPTEAEFEKAVKGGVESQEYPWGNKLHPNGIFRANLWQGKFPYENLGKDGYPYSSPVDAFGPQNDYGLYNVIGNVWEWVADAWVVRHPTKAQDGSILKDPVIEFDYRKVDYLTVERVKKGGSFMCHKSYCFRYRSVSRSSNTADTSAQNLGFRCAKSIDMEK